MPAAVVAILGKTEGNGCVNDFSRAFAVQALQSMLTRYLSPIEVSRICMVMSGGTEGALAPHLTVFEVRDEDDEAGGPAQAIGVAHTPALPAENLGRREQVEMVAAGVREAMAKAGLDDPAAVHFVLVKCPLLTSARIAETAARGKTVATSDTLKSMGLSRGASALGVASALGEVDPAAITDDVIGRDVGMWSARASTSGGIELLNHEIMVLGLGEQWSGPLAVDHAVMADGIDIEPVRAALARLGLDGAGQLSAGQRDRLVAVLAKAEAGTTGMLRGNRHTMLNDSDISATRHARAFVGGVLAGLVGHAELFVSGGAEHQGPDGGGPVALIVRRQV